MLNNQELNNQDFTLVGDKQANTPMISPAQYGWVCPKCGAVMSPFISFCPNCTSHNFDITCTTGGTGTFINSNMEVSCINGK